MNEVNDSSESRSTSSNQADPNARDPTGRGRRWIVRVLLVVLILAAIWLYRRVGPAVEPWLRRFGDWVDDLGVVAPFLFMGLYAAATVFFVPGFALTLVAGAVFGFWFGTLYVMIGSSLGAMLAFLVGRHLARAAVERRVRENRIFATIDRAVGEQGLKIALLLRLSPGIPFNVLNYALGLTRVRFLHYNIASLGMLPGTMLYVYLGNLGGRTLDDVEDVEGAGWLVWSFRLLGLAMILIVTILIGRIARRALSEEVGADPIEDSDHRARSAAS